MAVIPEIKKHTFAIVKQATGIVFTTEANKQYYEGLIAQMPEGTKAWIAIQEERETRSASQNNYYWLYLTGIADQTGSSKNALHQDFKEMFLKGVEETSFNGKKKIVYPSTTELTIKEFMEYIKEIETYTGILSPDTSLCGLNYWIERGIML